MCRAFISFLCFGAVDAIDAIDIVGFPGGRTRIQFSHIRKISAGMGDAVTESELAALLSSLSPGADSSTADHPGTAGSEREDLATGAAGPEVDFHDFVRLFRGVF